MFQIPGRGVFLMTVYLVSVKKKHRHSRKTLALISMIELNGLGNSSDLNPAEHIGTIMKNNVESKMIDESGPDRYSIDTLLRNLNQVLAELEFYTVLLDSLLK